MPADARRYAWPRAADAVAIGVLSSALNLASHGNWLTWFLINVSLGWLCGRIRRPHTDPKETPHAHL